MKWTEISPQDAADCGLILPHPDVEGPLTQDGEPCPWPWDPIQLKGQPIGQYHCPYCGEMCVAGMDHTDWSEELRIHRVRN